VAIHQVSSGVMCVSKLHRYNLYTKNHSFRGQTLLHCWNVISPWKQQRNYIL